jgi:hypothetical protein
LFKSNWLNGAAPTIDGVVPAGEWDEAYNNTVIACLVSNPSDQKWLSLYMMNDANNLYILAKWTDTTSDPTPDGISIFFDEENENYAINQSNHVVELTFYNMGTMTVQYTDAHGAGVTDVNTTDGEAGVTWNPNTYKVEFRIPLNAADIEDLNVGAGAMIGLAVYVFQGGAAHEYPFGVINGSFTNPFQLAAAPAIGTPALFLIVLIIGLLGLISTWRKKYF